MEYREPWHGCGDSVLVIELRREVVRGHILYGLPVRALAHRQDRNDVLYEIQDGSGRLAKVHLTWQQESNPKWPSTVLFSKIEEWSEAMNADCAEYGV